MNEHRTSSLPRPKKRFGQNFLVDRGYASKIVALASPSASDIIVEIGPGRGAITRILAERGCGVYALEIDRELHSHLFDEFRDTENVTILGGDALSFDFEKIAMETGSRLKIVANLPYNVATPILFRLLDVRENIVKMVLMFQKEVADRIVALPGTKNFGALSIFPQLYADISTALTLPPGAFRPSPKIHSSVLLFDLLDAPRFQVEDETLLRRVVSTIFSQRRKKLSNSLKPLFSDMGSPAQALSDAGIDPGLRPEELSLEEICLLGNTIYHIFQPKY